MRRFLDWTAVQSVGQLPAPNPSSSLSNSSTGHPTSKQASQSTQGQSGAQLPSNSASQSQYQQHTSNPARDLEIQHLARLLHEIKYHQASSSPLPSAKSSQSQREFVEKIHKTLPLFLNVFSTPAATFTTTPFTPTKSSSQSSVDQGDGLISESNSTSSKPNSPLPPKWPHMERFPDLLPFAFTVARLFVSEVRQRASNKHAEDASLAILKFLNKKAGPSQPVNESNVIPTANQELSNNREDENESSTTNRIDTQGWNLLSTLNVLALSQSMQIIQLLCDASLPSTLIKCLYLFFDFPDVNKQQHQDDSDQSATNQEGSVSFSRRVTTGPLIRAFNQLLVQLCSYQPAIDELIKKDDLRLLIGMASSQCSTHNKPWRKIAFQTLLAISRNMRDNFVYLEQNLCIQIYVENVHRINSLGLITTGEFIDMIKNLIEFLYNLDVNNRNQPKCIIPLIEQFKSSRLIDLIEELISKIDEIVSQENIPGSPLPSVDSEHFNTGLPSISSEATLLIDEHRRQGRRLIQSLSTLAKINTCQDSMTELVTLRPLAMSRFEMLDQFKLIRPSAKNCILNLEALQLMKMVWSKCRDGYLIESTLDVAISLFNDDKVKQKLFKFLEFIIIETNYIPCLELGTLGTLIKRRSCPDTDLILTLRTLVACLRFNSKFSDIFRDIGLLEVIIDTLIEHMQRENKMNLTVEKVEILYLLLETSQYLVVGPNNQNCTQFNESGAARHVFNCISKPEFFHLFVPAQNSSSDDSSNLLGPNSRTSTPSMTASGTRPYSYHHERDFSDVSQTKPSVKQLQKVAFTIIRQLILSSVGDEHLANLLGLLARNLDDLRSYGENLVDSEGLSSTGPEDDKDSQSTPVERGANMDFHFLLSQEVTLKTCILKSLMIVLKESHRCRRLFRKAGGFIYIVSAITTLANSLPNSSEQIQINPEESESSIRWRKLNSRRIWRLIKNSLTTIVVAMRLEPANQRTFSEEVINKFTEAIRGLGCFVNGRKSLSERKSSLDKSTDSLVTSNDARKVYRSIFLAPPTRDFSTIANDNARPNEACCQLFRFLYDMSLDMGDGTSDLELYLERDDLTRKALTSSDLTRDHSSKSISFDYDSSSDYSREYGVFRKRSQLHKAPLRPPSLDLNFKAQAAANLTFPSTILAIVDLIPSCPSEDLMVFGCSIIKSLLQHERNQQMLCEAGLISKLIGPNWNISFTDKNHFLHEPAKYILEKLSRQSISPRELRMYLRLGNPLKCKNLDEIKVDEAHLEENKTSTVAGSGSCNERASSMMEAATSSEKIATDRIGTLISMMSDEKSKAQPPFVEFDMSNASLLTIFMPSIAPINCKTLPQHASTFLNSTLDVHTNEKDGILGGVGTVERSFPPPNGLTFSTWICIDKFPARSSDLTHNIRLLTIYRGSASSGKEYSCLRLQISALDRAVTISTQETLLFDNENRPDANLDPECNVRIWTPELLVERKWHHIVATLIRSSTNQTNINVFVDGSLVHNQRVCYISSFVGSLNPAGPLGGSSSNNANFSSAAAYVNAFIGGLPQTRIHLRTRWKQGPCHLVEDPWSSNFVQTIYHLGPHYIGNFQSSLKLSELAKFKSAGQDISRSQHQQEIAPSRNRHQLAHQQSSSAATQMARTKGGHNHLARVASSQAGSSSSSAKSQHLIGGGSLGVTQRSCVTEDKIIISLDARSISFLTLARMRKIYTRFDCRQVSRVLGLAMHENAAPIMLLHNTGVHLSGPSRGVGAVTLGYNQVRCFVPSPTEITIYNIGGCHILLGLVAQSETVDSFSTSLRCLTHALNQNTNLQAQMETINGYQILAVFLWKKKNLLNSQTLKIVFSMITGGRPDDADLLAAVSTGSASSLLGSTHVGSQSARRILQAGALKELICESFDLWFQIGMIDLILEFLYDLISSNTQQDNPLSSGPLATSTRAKNLKYVRDMDLLPQMFRLLSRCESQQQQNQSDAEVIEIGIKNLLEKSDNTTAQQAADFSQEFNSKAIYLIRQTVFELLNRTPRQSDILYFGQYLASLMPTTLEKRHSGDQKVSERPKQTINLRNILLKSLLQMMTKNSQKEVNNAMQEELVRILGFDWFVLFISSTHLDRETITIGFMNLMVVLSNDELYENFKNNSTPNGGWLKEPAFANTDDKFSIQLLGISNGMFAGLGGRRGSIKQEALETPNFLLLISCLTNLIELPRIYLMIFQTMLGQFTKLEPRVLDAIEAFDELNLDSLCDCLVGDTHHKRRKTLAESQFRCYELTTCLVHMVAEITSQYEPIPPAEDDAAEQGVMLECEAKNTDQPTHEAFPTELIRFLLYLYNNNKEFQDYCSHSYDLIDALAETLMKRHPSSADATTPAETMADYVPRSPSRQRSSSIKRPMTQHRSTKAILELSRLIILDSMIQDDDHLDQLHLFDRFINSLSDCQEAQGELVDMLLQHILLMIDSTARHNSIKTIGGSENVLHFQRLLVNSILISQVVTDKIWLSELYADASLSRITSIIDHQLCLTEQVFSFNELLPKHNPPHAFVMQRVLNRMVLYAVSRPAQHISEKMLLLDLLKKIYDNRAIIIFNHMHSPQSAEFFVCFTYSLMKIIEMNNGPAQNPISAQHSVATDRPSSLIERQYGHPSALSKHSSLDPSNTGLSGIMLVSMARKVWDAIYQSKKGVLSEAFDVSLSLPAFTLETSLDLLQLKPNINDCCERYWCQYLESEQHRPKRRLQARQSGCGSDAQSSSVSSSTSRTASGTATGSSGHHLLSGRLTSVVNAASFVSRVVSATAGTMASNVNLVGERLSQSSSRAVSSRSSNELQVAGGASVPAGGPPSRHAAASRMDYLRNGVPVKRQLEEAARAHIALIVDFISVQLSQKNHKLALHKYLCEEWLDTEREILLRERAVFGPNNGSQLDKWCLDITEGPKRMRKKLVMNTEQFYENYTSDPQQQQLSASGGNKSFKYRPPMSFDSYTYYLKTRGLHHHLLDLKESSSNSGPADKQPTPVVEISTSNASPGERSRSPNITGGRGPQLTSADSKQLDTEKPAPTSPTTPIECTINIDQSSPANSIYSRDLNLSFESLPSPLGSKLFVDRESPRPTPSEGDPSDGDSTSFVDFSPEIEAETNSARDSENSTDSLSVLRLLEKNERISHMFRCSRVQGLDTYEGLLLFGREHFYLVDGFTLLKTREIKDIDSLPAGAHDPIIPNSTPNVSSAHSKKACAKFSYNSVIEVHKRRYLLQPIALEVFSSDGRNTLVVFPRNIRNKVYSRLLTVATQMTSNAHESLAGQKSNVSVEGGSGLLSNLIGETSVTQRWVRGELSNFQYLMNLNTIAGRSYNDLMQYPIFPWILADYTSERLNLSKPSTFRDLSRPVGAQTSERLEQFKRRFAEWDDTETPPYHYGTFYSSAMIVASYMVRMEPFTQHFLRLQGGHFDLADRMFHSINDSWVSASKHNMADVKELIPEFFYLPEFLKNENKYDLGIKQNGMKLGDVILPKWAKDDPREFIRLHRAALESDYVSAHLHEWIDLIFGYKQQGQPAVDAVNVFHHLFYEGNVDIYNTDIDPIKKNAVIGFINNFGQVPKQLFKKPHPVKRMATSASCSTSGQVADFGPLRPVVPGSQQAGLGAQQTQRALTRSPSHLKQSNLAAMTFKDLKGPGGQIVQIDKNIVAVEQNKLLIPPEYCRYIAWGHPDRSLRLGLYGCEKSIFVWEGSDSLPASEVLCCTIPNNRTMITGSTESIITVWRIERMKHFYPLMNLHGHVEPVTCLASSQAYSLIVSGSRDRTAIVWDLNRLSFVRQLGSGPPPIHQGPISAVAINDSTGDIATCASSWLYLWSINGQLLAHIDSRSVVMQHSLSSSQQQPSAPTSAAASGPLHLVSVCFSKCCATTTKQANAENDNEEVIITGANDGSVAMWSTQ